MSSFQYIVVPVCFVAERRAAVAAMRHNQLESGHWMLLVANVTTQCVSVLNSLKSPQFNTAASNYISLFKFVFSYIIVMHLLNIVRAMLSAFRISGCQNITFSHPPAAFKLV